MCSLNAKVRERGARRMPISRVTSKGRVTIPADIRKALAIEPGDDLLFDLGSDRTAQLRVIKRRRLSDLYGALRPTQPFPGKEEIRKQVARALA
jgi:AbrB family looped-hinge helix DNA binding protein